MLAGPSPQRQLLPHNEHWPVSNMIFALMIYFASDPALPLPERAGILPFREPKSKVVGLFTELCTCHQAVL